MGRLGTRDVGEASMVAHLAAGTEGVELAGAMTHFATADDPGDSFFDEQLQRFSAWARELKAHYPQLIVHAANSAATLRSRASHFDMVRAGIGIYGLDPFGEDPRARALEPALALRSYVAEIKACAAGQSAGYGRRYVASHDTSLAVLPIGYGDGWRRALSDTAQVLIAGSRHRIVGVVSMDNLTVELGALAGRSGATVGAEAVLIGEQGDDRITAEQVAGWLGSINYEVTCGLTARVPRCYHRDGVELAPAEHLAQP
jgi:alanine racemase